MRACAGMPPLERWPFSGEQTRHLSKVLHHLREDSVEMCFARLSFTVIFSLSVIHKIQTPWRDLWRKKNLTHVICASCHN